MAGRPGARSLVEDEEPQQAPLERQQAQLEQPGAVARTCRSGCETRNPALVSPT
jgi:hypothetical protein